MGASSGPPLVAVAQSAPLASPPLSLAAVPGAALESDDGGGVGTGGDMLTALPVFGSVREEKMRNRISKDGKLVRSVSGAGGGGGGGVS